MTLILCEKPSVAADFNKVIKAKNFKGYYENNTYVITYCLGHLMELYKPEDYDPKFKRWNLEDLPIIPSKFLHKPIGSASEQLQQINTLLKKHTYEKIIIATDAGREGELIARLVLQFCKYTDSSKIYRFWSSEALTETVIEKNLQLIKPISAYDNLFKEGLYRSQADWLTGINFSRFFSVKTQAQISIGRVQTAVLNAIYERDKAIEHFKSVPYQQLEAIFEKDTMAFKGLFFEDNHNKFKNKEHLQKIVDSINTDSAKVTDITTSEVSKNPPKLLSLAKLQIEANKRYGFTADETLSIAQKLYEEYKCLSYPRTPSEVLATSNVELAREKMNLIKSIYTTYCKNVAFENISEQNKRIFNDAMLEDHHALIPLTFLPEKATESERKIYSLIVAFFIAAFSKNYVYDSTTLELCINEALLFKSKGIKIKQKGFTVALALVAKNEADENEKTEQLPDLSVGETVVVKELNILEKMTTPPVHFTDATILELMLNPKQDDSDKKLVGIGTEATRAGILKLLETRTYITHKKKNILITGLGTAVIEALHCHPELVEFISLRNTTEWEELLSKKPEQFLTDIRKNNVEKLINTIKNSNTTYPDYFSENTNNQIGKCPACGKPVFENSKSFYCSGYKSGCAFSIWKTVSNAHINTGNAKLLLSGLLTSLIEFTNKDGKKYPAKLRLNNEHKIEFIFEKKGVKK